MSSSADPRHLKPAVTVMDTQHLLQAAVKKHRFLAEMSASCTHVEGVGSAAMGARVVLRVVGGDGQSDGTVGADPDLTDVYLELRVWPPPLSGYLNVSSGSLVTSRAPPGGFPDSPSLQSFSGSEGLENASQFGALIRAEHVGDGYYEATFQPLDPTGYYTYAYEVAVVVETQTVSGDRFTPESYKAWLGSSLAPYSDASYGLAFSPLWGGVPTAGGGSNLIEGRDAFICAPVPSPPSVPPSPPPPPSLPPTPPPAASSMPMIAGAGAGLVLVVAL